MRRANAEPKAARGGGGDLLRAVQLRQTAAVPSK